jgi:hypothetical protein
MDTWAEQAVRELEVDLKRLDLDAEAKRTALEHAQAAYEAVVAERATVRGMLDWAIKKLPVQADAAEVVLEPAAVSVQAHAFRQPGTTEQPTQTDLAVHALRQLGGRANTAQVRERLEQAGYQYDQTQIRSALKYLAKKKNPQVEGLGPGEWRLLGEVEYVPDEPTAVPDMNGTKGVVPAMNGQGGSP